MTVVNQGRELAAEMNRAIPLAQQLEQEYQRQQRQKSSVDDAQAGLAALQRNAAEVTRQAETERVRLERRLIIIGRLGVLGADLLAEAEYTRKGDDYAARCRRVANMAADAAVRADQFLAFAEDNGWEVLGRRVVDDLVPALLDWDGNDVESAKPTDTVRFSPEALSAYEASKQPDNDFDKRVKELSKRLSRGQELIATSGGKSIRWGDLPAAVVTRIAMAAANVGTYYVTINPEPTYTSTEQSDVRIANVPQGHRVADVWIHPSFFK